MATRIHSMYWDNIVSWIPEIQASVFRELGLEVTQHNATGTAHGDWLDAILDSSGREDVVLFVDIDCFPLNQEIVERAFSSAKEGRIVGAAQTANHLADSSMLYAAPSFLCLSIDTWVALDRVSLAVSAENDAAMALTRAARDSGRELDLLMPTFVCCPKWPLGRYGATGFGTFYASEVFHLFQSRDNEAYDFALTYVAECILTKRDIDYIELHRRMNSVSMRFREKFTSAEKRLRRLGAYMGLPSR